MPKLHSACKICGFEFEAPQRRYLCSRECKNESKCRSARVRRRLRPPPPVDQREDEVLRNRNAEACDMLLMLLRLHHPEIAPEAQAA